jgi:hypothetical protein
VLDGFAPPFLPVGQGPPVSGLSPALRAKLDGLHKRYQADFTQDAQGTIQAFDAMRDMLSRRFHQLAAVDSAASREADKASEGLRKQHDDLYREMVAQINREVRDVAKRRGVGVLVNGPTAPPGSVDLTADALPNIESLHE